jgi:hypothetical protein
MATLTEQLYSQNHWVGIDGVQTIWNFTFAGSPEGTYIFPEHVKAYYLDENGARVNVTVTEDMLVGPYQLEVDPPIPASATRFVIYRQTPKDMPLVDFEGGSQVTEANLDRAARQAIYVAAEVLDAAAVSDSQYDAILERLAALEALNGDTSAFGFKALKRVTYTGASDVTEADNGKAHYKTDATDVNVPTGLPLEFLCTVANNSDDVMTLTFDGTAYLQDGSGDSGASFTVPARCTATVWQPSTDTWFLSGPITAA